MKLKFEDAILCMFGSIKGGSSVAAAEISCLQPAYKGTECFHQQIFFFVDD